MDKKHIGLSVSGGIDSCYLMHKYASLANGHHHHYSVLSVNHGLRQESVSEVSWVGSVASDLGFQFFDLTITVPKPASGIQAFARNERYKLLAQTAQMHKIDTIYLGHHSGDQAETVLSRFNHRSGYAGLCGMYDMFFYDTICFMRPLLNMSRQEILQAMTHKDYIHDPSNDNLLYERVRNRQFLLQNPDLKQKLLTLSHKARLLYYPILLERNSFLTKNCFFSPYGYCVINRSEFEKETKILQQEILKYAIKYSTGNFYIKEIPIESRKNFTISGAEICFNTETVTIYRENRNIVDYDIKRFRFSETGLHKDDDNIPYKAKQTLPSGYFTYKPQSLHYFVSAFDRVIYV